MGQDGIYLIMPQWCGEQGAIMEGIYVVIEGGKLLSQPKLTTLEETIQWARAETEKRLTSLFICALQCEVRSEAKIEIKVIMQP